MQVVSRPIGKAPEHPHYSKRPCEKVYRYVSIVDIGIDEGDQGGQKR
jgi:hypothetical protein